MDSSHIARIKWRCRRGMLELDLLLNKFLDCYAEKLSDKQWQNLEHLLEASDPVLYDWLLNETTPLDKDLAEIAQFIKQCY